MTRAIYRVIEFAICAVVAAAVVLGWLYAALASGLVTR